MDDTKNQDHVGYSDRINDSAFQIYLPKQDGKQSLKYLLVLIPVLVLFILWRGEILATWVFALLLLLTVLAALPPILKERRIAEDRTYDGTIDSIARREPVSEADIRKINPSMRNKMIFHTIRIADENGKLRTYEKTGGLEDDYRTYYTAGDRVRHHRGFELPEKYDKSQDDTVICIVCGRMNSMDSRKCSQCGTVLLK